MDKKKSIKLLIRLLYTLTITCMIGKWMVYMAYMQRGYQAIGGEYILILVVCWTAWKAVSYLLSSWEGFGHE